MKKGRKAGYRTPETIQMIAMIEAIPDDGCLILFNVDHVSWRNLLTRLYGGLFHLHVLQTFNRHYGKLRLFGDESVSNTEFSGRDIYICWRE